jgi:threonine/homoserine/homoserine lactone efflux protein
MQLLISLLAGTVLGVIMTIPLGPVSIYVAQKTIRGETRKGLYVSMGSVIIDILYCLVITLGLMALVSPYLQNVWVQLGLSLFLLLYGLKMLVVDTKAKPPDAGKLQQQAERNSGKRGPVNVLLGTFMALSNPTLFISWTAVLGFVSAHGLLHDTFWDKVVFSFASGFGSFLWFFGLALFVRRKRHTLSPSFVKLAGAITAFVVIGFGVYFSVTILMQLRHMA